MKVSRKIAAAAVLFGFLASVSVLIAADTATIDKVRAKGVLESADLQTIDYFVAQSVQELLKDADFTSVSKIRAGIVSRAGASSESSAAQYSQQYIESLHKHLSNGFKEVANLTSETLQFRATVNLLILIDELGDARLVDLALNSFDSKVSALRYAAVRCIVNPAIINQLRSDPSGNAKLVAQIIEGLKKIVDTAGAETIGVAVEFADKIVGSSEADLLLMQIADARIKQYADWTVKNEIVDVAVLGALSNKLSIGRSNQEFGMRFAQLYSYAIQRYIANIKGGAFLSTAEKGQLASVLVETGKSFIGKFSGIQQTTIKRAVETDDYVALWAEHSRLLGDETKTGEFAEKLKFNYGNGRISPLMLSEKK